jgi:phosphohistidine phosphatase
MKQIILFRHGKSSWADGSLPDDKRPLMDVGIKRTLKVAERLISLGVKPDLLVTSHATRAHRTADLVAGAYGFGPESIRVESALYHASPDAIWDVVVSLPETANSVILFGHNPEFTEFVNLAGISNIDWMPTSGVAGAIFQCNLWPDCPGLIPVEPLLVIPKNC